MYLFDKRLSARIASGVIALLALLIGATLCGCGHGPISVGPVTNSYVFSHAFGKGNLTEQYPNTGVNIPVYLAIDRSDNEYITDVNVTATGMNALNNTFNVIKKFDAQGNYLTQFSPSQLGPNAGVTHLEGLSIDSMGNLYVLVSGPDAVNNIDDTRVEKFDPQGNYVTQFGNIPDNGTTAPTVGMALDLNNNVFVLNADPATVQKFDSSGNLLGQIALVSANVAQTGSGSYLPTLLLVDSKDDLFVYDKATLSVHEFGSQGNSLSTFPATEFPTVAGYLAIDSGDNFYALNRKKVQKFNSQGTLLTQFGSSGAGAGQFYNPTALAVRFTGDTVSVYDTMQVLVFTLPPS